MTAERLDHFIERANRAYYANRDPFTDFTTAPEISQVFGELLGAWAATVWHALGRPDPVILAELGPGRGTLMADALRLIGRTQPSFAAALSLHLVEASPRLGSILMDRFPAAAIQPTIAGLPDQPTILLANEFFDALPVRQFVRRGGGWTERHVDGTCFVEYPAGDAPPLDGDGCAEGDIVERSEAALAIVRALAERAANGRLAALLLDYGGEGNGDTLQSLRDGRPSPSLENPGEADLTAHVDFAALGRAAVDAGANVHGPLAQGLFLTRLGLYERTRRLAPRAPHLIDAANRLAQPERMGVLFKALAITPLAFSTPPGFEAV